MSGYSKNIAVIRGLKDGFSADGGALTGLIKAERYGSGLKVEATYINFAPLSEGRYVAALSDGKHTLIVENGFFEGQSELDTSKGFAALICFINGQVSPIASAVSGNFHGETLGIKAEVERLENIKIADAGKTAAVDTDYEDEAIAEVNYYEFAKTDEGGGAVREDKKKEKGGNKSVQNEEDFSAFKKEQSGVDPRICLNEEAKGGLAGGNFYARMRGEIDGLLKNYPHVVVLEKLILDSEWVRIEYAQGKFYVFGIIREDTVPRYICYGVPTAGGDAPPESMKNLASFIGVQYEEYAGFWVMYQDASTGVSLKVETL